MRIERVTVGKLFLPVAVLLVPVGMLSATAQVKTSTETKAHPSTLTVNVEMGEVVLISGNDLVLRMEDGELRDFPDVPDSATVTVDGKTLTIRDLKPGMKLQRTTITSAIPRMITTTKTVTGKVTWVQPPSKVRLQLDDGTNQMFTIPSGQKFNIQGTETDAWHLTTGMQLSATQVTVVPETVVDQNVIRTGTLPPPPEPPAPNLALLIVQ